ncbi:MAG: putative glycosyl transferase [Elusimicrobia bacterium]|nr:MAG: putative glycosyl transferase [Elusimicrobiota bacterium]
MIRVRFHSDCDYFAGCENMLANFFNDAAFVREHDVSFSYRASAEYEKTLKDRVPDPPRPLPLDVVDFHQLTAPANGWPAPLRGLYKAALRLLLAKYWLFLYNVWTLYRSLGPDIDVLHVNNGGFPGAASCLAAGLAARLRGVKAVVHVVNNLPVPYSGPDRWLDWPLDRLAAGTTTVFVTASGPARRSMMSVVGLPEGRTAVLPNGIAARALTQPPADVRRRLKVPEGRLLVSVVAVLEPRKGHAVLLEALARMKKAGGCPFPMTALGGDGFLRPELEAQARALGLADDVLFLGWEPRHFDLFNASDVVALPSARFEDFPNVILEAMSLGKTVVATRVGGVEEQIEDGVTGLLVKPGDVDDLTSVLTRACRDAALRQRLGAAAAARFGERFTAQASVERYRTLYRDLLSARMV